MDAILFWNAVGLEANQVSHSNGKEEQTGPTLSSRALAIMHLAMFDAFVGAEAAGPNVANLTPYLTTPPIAAPAANASIDAAVAAAAHATLVLTGFAEGALIQAARTLADRAGHELLARKHLSNPAQLSVTARDRWRTQTKSLVAQELSTLTGHGIHAAHTIVAFALAPPQP